MFITKFKVFKSHGRQFIANLADVELTERFRGRPVIHKGISSSLAKECVGVCPTQALVYEGSLSLDVGRCIFCNECTRMAPDNIKFTNDYRLATNIRNQLIVSETSPEVIVFSPEEVRKEITKYFGRALKLRSVCAGGDNSTEMELGASMNVNFDFSRYGIEFVASPRHADGMVISGAITANMAAPLKACYEAISEPKLIILAGTDAVSGGLFAGSKALDRSFLERHTADLYIPGNPVHPMTFIDGVMTLVGRRKRERSAG